VTQLTPTDMKTFSLILLAHLGLIMSVHAQGGSRLSTPSTDQKKQLQQAAQRLREAQTSGELDQAKSTAKELLKNLPSSIKDAAQSAAQSPELKAQAMDAVKSAAQSILPQAQGLLRQPGTPAAVPTPAPVVMPAVQDQPPKGPKPLALAPIAGGNTAVDPNTANPTAIIEADNSVFDLKTSVFIYTGHVRARHPDFYIECEELEVHMVKQEESKGGPKPAPKVANDPILIDGKKKSEAPPIKKAIARGPMVTIEKRSEQGDVQQGKCRRLDYDGATGDITLSDYPQVQRGNVLQIATQSDTTMVFKKSGKFITNGRPRTVILNDAAAPAANPNAQ
jgi:lipopolysaccharide export system protein LptA